MAASQSRRSAYALSQLSPEGVVWCVALRVTRLIRGVFVCPLHWLRREPRLRTNAIKAGAPIRRKPYARLTSREPRLRIRVDVSAFHPHASNIQMHGLSLIHI